MENDEATTSTTTKHNLRLTYLQKQTNVMRRVEEKDGIYVFTGGKFIYEKHLN